MHQLCNIRHKRFESRLCYSCDIVSSSSYFISPQFANTSDRWFSVHSWAISMIRMTIRYRFFVPFRIFFQNLDTLTVARSASVLNIFDQNIIRFCQFLLQTDMTKVLPCYECILGPQRKILSPFRLYLVNYYPHSKQNTTESPIFTSTNNNKG